MSNTRSARCLLSEIDREELKCLKVAILRHSVPEKASEPSLVRGLDDPKQLNIHYRTDEGRRPIFDREDIVVNIHKAHKEPTLAEPPSASTRRARSRSKERPPPPRETYRERSRSPLPHTSRESSSRNHEYYSRNRRSPSPGRSRRYSKSPGRYEKRRSRSRGRSRSPYKHRVVERERRRTRSRSRSPYRRSRSRDYHRRERSSRRTRYSPERRRTRSKSPPAHSASRMPEYIYYQGDEYWIPQPMPPRFMQRGYLPPGPYPRAMPPGPVIMPRLPLAPMMIPPHPAPFRPRLPVYNSRPMPKPVMSAATATTTTVTTTQGCKAALSVTTSAVVDSSGDSNAVSGSDCAKTTHNLHDD